MGAAKREFIGLDIGSHSLKLVQLKRSAKGLKLQRFVVKELPSETIAGGKILSPERLKESLSAFLREQKLKNAYGGIALPGVTTEVAVVKIPRMDAQEVRESIAWEYQQHLAHDPDDVVLDCQALSVKEGMLEEKMNVLIAGADKKIIAKYVDVIGESGLTLSEIEVSALTLANAWSYNSGSEADNALLLHAGAEVTEVVILQGGLPIFVRAVEGGGNNITRALKDGLGVDFEKAESFKKGSNIPQDLSYEVKSLVENGAEELASKVREALEAYKTLWGRGWGDRVMLSGGCSKLPALCLQLKKQLSGQLELANPFKRVDYKKFNPRYIAYYAPEAMVAVGLALKGVMAHD